MSPVLGGGEWTTAQWREWTLSRAGRWMAELRKLRHFRFSAMNGGHANDWDLLLARIAGDSVDCKEAVARAERLGAVVTVLQDGSVQIVATAGAYVDVNAQILRQGREIEAALAKLDLEWIHPPSTSILCFSPEHYPDEEW